MSTPISNIIAIDPWSQILYNISPFFWGYTGISIALGFSDLGAA